MPNARITTDFADGFHAGFTLAKTQIEAAVERALAEHTSVRKAIGRVQVPVPARAQPLSDLRGE